ncbi:hypothetical protein Bhyg_05084 [Pseudolycoriella hygida]|uniref:Uncharacterized protein n=1 Tax=Pseudolycoriella hygida TaxID=35572 RepID=A0A9Q0NGS8_9DIPT|nr:hypothetical protein Bhyg_05084 [Pseudolycoriella hygida]
MSNVPDKFYQVCRLCLMPVCASDVPKLSMYDISKLRSPQSQANQQINNTVIINSTQKTDEVNALNHQNDSLHKLAADKDTNVTGLLKDSIGDGMEDDDDESRVQLHELIFTFLAITVSLTEEL